MSIDSYGENGGWNESDHLEFVGVLNQYPIDLPQRNMLLFDRLQRQFPDRSTSELVSAIKGIFFLYQKRNSFHEELENTSKDQILITGSHEKEV